MDKILKPDLKDIKLVASDLDDTLLLEDSTLPPDIFDLINEMEQNGIAFSAASGRPYTTLKHMFGPVLEKIYCMSHNGAYIVKNGETVFKSMIPRNDYLDFLDFTLKNTNGIPFLCGMESVYTINRAREYNDYFRIFFRDLNYDADLKNVQDEIAKFTIYFPDGNSVELFDKLFKPAFADSFYVTTGNDYFIDIQNKGINKGRGILEIGKDMNITPYEMMAFGDEMNDKEMMETVYFSYSVKNATRELKEIARFEAPPNTEEGVLTEIRKVLLKKAN